MKQVYLKSFFLSLLMMVIGNVGALAAPGDEIKSPDDVVSGKSYYIKGVYTSSKVEYTCYYAPNDVSGKFTDAAVMDINDALPITFTQVDGGWTLTTPNGYYVRPHTSNGQTYLEEDEVVLQLSSGETKEGPGKGIKIGPYTSGDKKWYLQCNNQNPKIGAYQNSQWDVTLIECGSTVSSAATFAETSPSIEFPATNTYSQEVTTAEGYTGTVTYEITANTAGATIDGSTVTVTQAGSVTVKATAPAVEGFLSSTDEYTLTVTDAREDNGLAFAESSQQVTVGEVLNAPTLTNPNNLSVTYSSSDTNIATVDEDGNVTGVAAGTATITATFEGNDQYMAGNASYTINVKKVLPEGALFYESVSGYTGSTDNSTALSPTYSGLDYDNWASFDKVYAGKVVGGATDGHLKFGTGSAAGKAVTGSIALTGNGKLTYKVMRYDTSNAGKLTISATGADIAGDIEVTGTAEWVEKTVYLSNATGDVVITFATPTDGKRIRVDDILLVEAEAVEVSSAAAFAEATPSIDFPATSTYTQEATTAEGYTGTVTYEITANTAGATIEGSTVTVTKAGSVTVKATAPAVEGFLASNATYTLTVNDVREECGLAFAESSQEINVGDVLDAPTLTNPNNLSVTYSSSDTNIATVDEDGNVTGVAAGTATITATFEGNDLYKAGSASYTINVKKDLPEGVLFYESVSGYTGSTDNSTALSTTYSGLDYDNWASFDKVYAGKVVGGATDGHLKFGTGSAAGKAVTGSIALTGNGRLTYKVMRYDSNGAGKLTVSVTGATVEDGSDTEVTGTAEWVEKTVYLSGAEGNVVITFETDASDKRIRVDDIILKEAAPKSPLASIEVKDYTMYFMVGDTFEFDGTVTAVYEDETTKDVTEKATISEPDMSTAGEQTVTVSYTEGEITKTAEYIIDVNEPETVTFRKITSADELVPGKRYVLVNEEAKKVIAQYYNKYFEVKGAEISDEQVALTEGQANFLTLGGEEGAWTFATSIEADKYLALTSAGNYLESKDDGESAQWTISFDEAGNAVIQSNYITSEERVIRYNSSQPRFACYKGTQKPVQLYVESDLEDVTLTITAAGYATLYYSDRALKVPEDVTAKTYKVVDGKLAESKKYEAGSKIPKGEAVVLKGARGEYTFKVTSTPEPKDADNMLKGSDEAEWTTGGTYYYALQAKSKDGKHGPGMYWMNSTGARFENGAHKAYMALDELFAGAQAVGGAKEFYLFDEATTGISGIDAASADRTEMYNLNGQRVGNGYKGVVIKNGKKILRK